MIAYQGRQSFSKDSIPKSFSVTWSGGSLSNSDIVSESFTFTENLTSNGKFNLGDCVSSYVEFEVGESAVAMEGKVITISCAMDDPDITTTVPDFVFGTYKVVSDKPTADRRFRKIVAYDALQEVLSLDITDWYNTVLFPDNNTTWALTQVRALFFDHVGIEEEVQTLINDNLEVKKAEGINQLSGGEFLKALCEVNACFGHMTRDNKFRYVELGSTVVADSHVYQSIKYEDYVTDAFTKVIIRSEQNTIGVAAGQDGGSVYEVVGNFFTFKMSWADFSACATNILSAISGISFRPAQISAMADPCIEVGDLINFDTTYCSVTTYVFQRKIKGLQYLRDTITSKGEKTLLENPNSTSAKINQITGRINEIKADLITADSIITQNLNSAVARIGTIETNYITAGTVAANYATISDLNSATARIGTLESTAITTTNLSSQTIYGSQISGLTINANQITAGTIATARLDTGAIATATVTVTNICAALHSPGQGTITIGTIRVSSFQYYTGQGYTTLSLKTFTVGGTTYHCLGY